MERSTWAVAATVVLFSACSIWLKADLRAAPDEDGPLPTGTPAPAATFETLEGKAVELAEVTAGHPVVLINFWATWCQPCRIEMPLLQRIYEEHGDRGLEILAVTNESPAVVREFLEEHDYTFPILLDPRGEASEAYGVEVLPTSVLIGSDGKVTRYQRGINPAIGSIIGAALPARQPETQ